MPVEILALAGNFGRGRRPVREKSAAARDFAALTASIAVDLAAIERHAFR